MCVCVRISSGGELHFEIVDVKGPLKAKMAGIQLNNGMLLCVETEIVDISIQNDYLLYSCISFDYVVPVSSVESRC